MHHSLLTLATQVRRRTLCLAVAVLAPLGILGVASPALAVEHHPKGDFAPFADCPLSNPATNLCIFAQTESGEFVIGKATVPITKTITLQGGIHENETTGLQEFIGAEDGNTLSKTPQKVPGGLLGLIKCNEIKGEGFLEKTARKACEAVFENGLTGVNATAELAAPASSIGISIQNLIEENGVALSLPVKVHLENPLLGSSCYVGSNAHPVVIELTTGTTSPPPPNKPIKGKVGTLEFKDEFNLVIARNNSLVNNSFAAPKSEGCGGLFSFLIGPLVDSKLGLPSPAGHNTAILNGTLQDANAPAVKASE
jgi:hypothetical protein